MCDEEFLRIRLLIKSVVLTFLELDKKDIKSRYAKFDLLLNFSAFLL